MLCDACASRIRSGDLQSDPVVPPYLHHFTDSGEPPKNRENDECLVPGCGSIKDHRPGDPFNPRHLLSMDGTWDAIRNASGAANTAKATAIAAGKLTANAIVITGKIGWATVKKMAEEGAKKGLSR